MSTPPYEVHTLKIRKDGNQFIVFSEGVRGGKDYESDTFRVPSIINEKNKILIFGSDGTLSQEIIKLIDKTQLS